MALYFCSNYINKPRCFKRAFKIKMRKLGYILNFIFLFSLSCCENEKSNKEIGKKKKETIQISEKSSTERPFLNAQLSYSIIKERKSVVLKNDSLKGVINNWLKRNKKPTMDELVDFILDLTKNQLAFSFGKCSSNPNALVKKQKANCIGYSALFSSLMNYTLTKKQLDKRYECYHYVGKIYYAGQNINALFNDPFFKDHDFNMIRDIEHKNDIVVDPSLYEYLGIRRVSLRK